MRRHVAIYALFVSILLAFFVGCGKQVAESTDVAFEEKVDTEETSRIEEVLVGKSEDADIKKDNHYETVEKSEDADLVIENVSKTVRDCIESVEENAGEITPKNREDLIKEVSQTLEKLLGAGEILDYGVNDSSSWYINLYGDLVVYIPSVDGYKNGDDRVLLSTLQPCREDLFGKGFGVLADDSGDLVCKSIDRCEFYRNLDDSKVTLEEIKKIKSGEIVIWDGHGAYADGENWLVVGESCSSETDFSERYGDLKGVGYCTDGKILIGHDFITNYMGDLSNTFIFLSTCYSAVSYQGLIAGFVENGAACVVGSTESIKAEYADNMMYKIFDVMTQLDENGEYYSIGQAIIEARRIYGNDDCEWYSMVYGGSLDKEPAAILASNSEYSFNGLPATAEDEFDVIADGRYFTDYDETGDISEDLTYLKVDTSFSHYDGSWNEICDYERKEYKIPISKECKVTVIEMEPYTEDLAQILEFTKNWVQQGYGLGFTIEIENGEIIKFIFSS